MSDTDSFIEEVNEEVRRDRLFTLLKRYGWIGALIVILIVGGAAWSEYQKAQATARAQALGDGMLTALSGEDSAERLAALEALSAENATGQALLAMLTAGEAQRSGNVDTAIAALDAVSVDPEVAEIYRQIASFKSLTLQAETSNQDARRQGFEALSMAGSPLRLLAEEQLALMDVADGDVEAAIDRFQSILQDASVTSDLQQRALQVIVALGGTPDLENLPTTGN
ncbi:tetratricopeptide repeat protein [Roseobacter sp.]|uniref:tetratricopeptide repeat protein n=1 Tax=Roseobacter sp. TaxID=1907202 RepID=UPI00385BEF38